MAGDKAKTRRLTFFSLSLGCLSIAVLTASIFSVRADQAEAAKPLMETSKTSEDEANNSSPITYSLRIYKEADRIKLKGEMPSEDDYKTLIGLVKANFPSITVSDRVKVTTGEAAPDLKIGGLSFALKILGYLDTGRATVDNNGLHLEGETGDNAVREQVARVISLDTPLSVDPKNIKITSPAPSFTWRAEITPGRLTFSGGIPDEAKKQALADLARQTFTDLELVDHTNIVPDVPANWAAAATHSLDILKYLQSGSVEISALSIVIEGNTLDEQTLYNIDAMTGEYPPEFALETRVKSLTTAGIFTAIPAAAAAENIVSTP